MSIDNARIPSVPGCFSFVDDLAWIETLCGPRSAEDKLATVSDVVTGVREGFKGKQSLLRKTIMNEEIELLKDGT